MKLLSVNWVPDSKLKCFECKIFVSTCKGDFFKPTGGLYNNSPSSEKLVPKISCNEGKLGMRDWTGNNHLLNETVPVNINEVIPAILLTL